MNAIVHIGLMVDLSCTFGRDVCRGAAQFFQEQRLDWRFVPGAPDMAASALPRWLEENRIAGVIVDAASRELSGRLADSGVPLVNLAAQDAARRVTSVLVDEAAVGRMGAEFFLTAGFRNFAYCGDGNRRFSAQCGLAFRDFIRKHGKPVQHTPAAWMREWLCGLPKPVAVLADTDRCALQVLRCAQDLGFAVPGQVAVLGVGDDDVLCSLATPKLSSIAVGGEEIGRAAAQALDGLRRGSLRPGVRFSVQPQRVVERQSTGIEMDQHPLVFKSLQLIRDGIRGGISVGRICREVGCPRPTLDRLFKASLGRTVSEEIIRVRLKQVTEQLLFTDLSLGEIAKMFHFPTRCRFSQFVKKWAGVPALEVRRGKGREFLLMEGERPRELGVG